MKKIILTAVTSVAILALAGCAEKRSCCNPPKPVAPKPAPVVEVPKPAPAPVVVEEKKEVEVIPCVVEPAPVVDDKTRAVQ